MVRPFADETQPSHLLWNVFELATLEHLCYIAQIPLLRRSVNEYFRIHFRGKKICFAENERPLDEYFRYFRRSVQQISIRGMDVATFNYVALHFPNLSKITFESDRCEEKSIPIERADILSQQMRMVKRVVFNADQFRGPIYDRLLEHGRKYIQILIINTTSANAKEIDPSVPDGSQWYSKLYPYLSTLQWDEGIISNPRELQQLLVNNANIHHLIFTRDIALVIDFMERFNVQLHRLDVKFLPKDLPNIKLICYRLNQLFDSGHFKQLHVTLDRDRHIRDYRLPNLNGLKGIVYNGEYVPAIGECAQLTDLTVDSMNDGFDAANQFNALRTLCITKASISAINPFICAAPQIMKIVIRTAHVDALDVHNFRHLAEQRGRLPNAQRLKIFLDEPAYCTLKPYETQHTTPWINIRRIEELLN